MAIRPNASLWMHTFRVGCPTHVGALAILVLVCVILCRWGWAVHERDEGRQMDRAFAHWLFALWGILLLFNLTPGRLHWGKSLPLHVCDIVGLAAPIGLLTNRRWARNLTYFWGLGLCTQALVTPILFLGPAHLDFWCYWSCHIAIIAAAVYELTVRRYRPTWSDGRQMALFVVAYVALVTPVNLRFGVNYGYIGRGDFCQSAAILAFGSWPARVPLIALTTWGVIATMTVAWPHNRRVRPVVGDPVPAMKAFAYSAPTAIQSRRAA